jgi:hypothetical protein
LRIVVDADEWRFHGRAVIDSVVVAIGAFGPGVMK